MNPSTRQIEVLFSPAEFELLPKRDLSVTACVVLDVLRATSTIATALASGARAVIPVATVEEALSIHRAVPGSLLAGERGGLRIRGEQTGGIDFHFGNSPREFLTDRVQGKSIIITTTNGTRALKACSHAAWVLAGCFLNITATARLLGTLPAAKVMIVCSGTGEEAALEDSLMAGALCQEVSGQGDFLDSALLAVAAWQRAAPDLSREIRKSQNARRLLTHAELAPDVEYCLRRDIVAAVPMLHDGAELRLA